MTTARLLVSAIAGALSVGCSVASPTPTLSPSMTVAPGSSPNSSVPPSTPSIDDVESSEGKIASALAGGEIDQPTSLLYRVYAAFGDPALPQQYQSPIGDLHAATFAFAEIAQHESELNAETRAALAPYLARPNDPASIFNQPPPVGGGAALAARGQIAAAATPSSTARAASWVDRSAAGGKARVWVEESPIADALLEAYAEEVTKVWPKVFTLTREPLHDAPFTPSSLVNPDDAIDVYFSDLGAIDPRVEERCTTVPVPEDCPQLKAEGGYTSSAAPIIGNTSSAWVVIHAGAPGGVSGDVLTSHIAHELMHTSQFSYDYNEGAWLHDSTATWGAYRTLQMLGRPPEPEYEYLHDFFAELDRPLRRDDALDRYASWLYIFSLQIDHGDEVARKIFEQTMPEGPQGAAAIDALYPFAANFPKFVLSNWNMDTAVRYGKHDATFPAYLQPGTSHFPQLAPGDVDQLPWTLPFLASEYASYTFTDEVRQVIFDNPFTSVVAECNCIPAVWLIANVRGTWQAPQQLVEGRREFCFERPEEDLEELVVVVGNTDWEGLYAIPRDLMPTISASDHCELGDAFGTISWSRQWEFTEESGTAHAGQEQAAVNIRLRATEEGWEDIGSNYSWTGEEHVVGKLSNECPEGHDDSTTTGGGPFAGHEGAYVQFGVGEDEQGRPVAGLTTLVQGQLHGVKNYTLYSYLQGKCVPYSGNGEYSQGGDEWTQYIYCDMDDPTTGLSSQPSSDGRTFEFSCSDSQSGEGYSESVQASGSVTVVKQPSP